MATATLTSKGQTTVPREIRDGLKLEPGDKLHFTLLRNGTALLRAKKHTVATLAGLLHDPGRKPVTLAQMNIAVTEAAVKRAKGADRPGQRPKHR